MFGRDHGAKPQGGFVDSLAIGELSDHLRDAVIVADDGGRIVLWNPAATTMFGYSADEAIGRNVEMLVPRELRGEHRVGFGEWRRSGAGRYIDTDRPLELPGVARDGSRLQVELTLSPLHDGDRRYVLAILRDVTARKALESELVRRSLRDELTDLPNRILFLDSLRRGLANARWRKHGLGLLVIDLARFAELRASVGDGVADELLAQVGQRLAQAVPAEELVARLEADLFGVLLLDLDAEDTAGETADRLLALLQTPFRAGGKRIVLGACIGVAVSDNPRQPAEELLRDAELALLEAKRKGSPSWHRYDRSIAVPITSDSLDLVGDLRLAIERGEFVVHYQPILRLADESLYGFEALVRWQHPLRGLLTPAEFIDQAERHGLIGQIDAWVLREACRQGAVWQAAHPGEPALTIAANVSASALRQESTVDHVRRVIGEHPLVPGSLLLEITETSARSDSRRTAAFVDAVRGEDVRVAIDDFGADIHALSDLRDLALDVLKIDREFVAGLDDGRTAKIVAAVIALAHALDMDVVAEGVEAAEQARILREMGCDLVQGHLYSPAVDAESAGTLIWEGQPAVVGAPPS